MLWKADRTTALALAVGLATLSPALLHAQIAAGPGGVRGMVTTTADEPVATAANRRGRAGRLRVRRLGGGGGRAGAGPPRRR